MESVHGAGAGESLACGARSWRASLGMLGCAAAAGAAIIASSLLLRAYPEMDDALRLGAALMPVVPFAFMFVLMVRAARRLDELHSRIQMEALSMTVVITVIVAVAWGQLQKAGFAAKGELSEVLPLMAFVYAACLTFSMRRYR